MEKEDQKSDRKTLKQQLSENRSMLQFSCVCLFVCFVY